MRKTNNASPLVLIFLADAVAMTVEMVAARILSPYFGSSNAVWTAVIGVILLAGSIGNYYGGRLADRHPIDPMVRRLLWMTSCWILAVAVTGDIVSILLARHIHMAEIGALATSLLLFLSPAAALGMVTPMLMRKALRKEENGAMTGRFYATMTAGGLTGTFLGGFILIPSMGCVQMLCAVALVLGWMAYWADRGVGTFALAGLMTFFAVFFYYGWKYVQKVGDDSVRYGELHHKVSMDTRDGHVTIYNGFNAEGDSIRIMNVSGGHMSAAYLDPKRKYELPFPYTRAYDEAVGCFPYPPSCLMIGGAGYGYPKYLISHFPGTRMDVVEIDPEITRIARRYFYLDDFEREYNTKENKRLRIFHEDGRVFLNNTGNRYDIIMNDAFSGEVPTRQLATVEAARTIKERLRDGGVYATNVILSKRNVAFSRCEYHTLSKVFRHVYVIPVSGRDEKNQNLMMLAADRPLALSKDTVLIHHLPEDVVFTDNYCPVERIASYAGLADVSLSGAEQLSKKR